MAEGTTTERQRPSQSMIDSVLNLAANSEEHGRSAYPGQTYEEGVIAGIRWLQGQGEPPLGPEANSASR